MVERGREGKRGRGRVGGTEVEGRWAEAGGAGV